MALICPCHDFAMALPWPCHYQCIDPHVIWRCKGWQCLCQVVCALCLQLLRNVFAMGLPKFAMPVFSMSAPCHHIGIASACFLLKWQPHGIAMTLPYVLATFLLCSCYVVFAMFVLFMLCLLGLCVGLAMIATLCFLHWNAHGTAMHWIMLTLHCYESVCKHLLCICHVFLPLFIVTLPWHRHGLDIICAMSLIWLWTCLVCHGMSMILPWFVCHALAMPLP